MLEAMLSKGKVAGGSGVIETLPSMPTAARFDHVMEVVGDVLYVGGGRNASSQYLQDFHKYDFATRQWAVLPDMPTIVNATMLSANGTKLYLWGRSQGVSVFDTVTETWTPGISNNNWYIYGGVAGYYNGKLYAVGCQNGQPPGRLSVLIHDILAGTWSLGANASIGVVYPGGGIVGNRLYTLCGNLSPDARLRWYDMDGNYHGFGPDTGYPPSSYYMTGTELNGKLYVIGGANGGSTVLDKVIQYDPVTDKITSLKKLPKPICQAGIVSYQDKLYILGGSLAPSAAPTNDFFSYSIAPG